MEIYKVFMDYLKIDCDYADTSIVHKELTVRLVIHILIQKNVASLDEIGSDSMHIFSASGKGTRQLERR